MCLYKIEKVYDEPLMEEREGFYKVVLVRGGRFYPPVWNYDGKPYKKTGWNVAKETKHVGVAEDGSGKVYPLGFHCFVGEVDKKHWLMVQFPSSKKVVKCKVRGIVAEGIERYNRVSKGVGECKVIVAKEIKFYGLTEKKGHSKSSPKVK